MVTIRKVECPANKINIKCPYKMTPTRIVIHNTANDAPAKNEIAYMHRNGNTISFHFAVDDIEIVQGIDLNRNAFHAGDGNGKGNREGIAIEICYSKSGGERFEKAQRNAAELTAKLLKDFGWGIDRVTKHKDYNGKHCPHRTLDQYGWEFFIGLVKDFMGETEKKEETKTTAAIKKGDKVKVNKGAKTYDGVGVAAFVYDNEYTVDELKGDRAVLGITSICTAFNVKDLTKSSEAVTKKPVAKPEAKKVTKGCKVKVKKGAKSYEGKSIAAFVYNNVYTVDELKGKRAVLDLKGLCTAFNTDDLIVQ